MIWEKLLVRTEKAFYTEFIMQFFCLLVIIVYFKKGKKVKNSIFLVAIAFASLIQTLIIQYHDLVPHTWLLPKTISKFTLYLYLLFEATCCLLFIKKHITSVIFRKIITLSNLLFIIYSATYWALKFDTYVYSLHIIIIESFLIIIPCLYFFYELFTRAPDKNIFNEPDFWVISGMLISFSIMTPFSLLFNYLEKNFNAVFKSLFLINYLSYVLLFITFIIAMLCHQKTTKSKLFYL